MTYIYTVYCKIKIYYILIPVLFTYPLLYGDDNVM